jgi:hypothetical protein
MANLSVVSEQSNETRLGELEEQIAEETRVLEDLRRRTHTLEIEVAGWRREPLATPPVRRTSVGAIEMMLGGFLGVLAGVVAKVLAMLLLRWN